MWRRAILNLSSSLALFRSSSRPPLLKVACKSLGHDCEGEHGVSAKVSLAELRACFRWLD